MPSFRGLTAIVPQLSLTAALMLATCALAVPAMAQQAEPDTTPLAVPSMPTPGFFHRLFSGDAAPAAPAPTADAEPTVARQPTVAFAGGQGLLGLLLSPPSGRCSGTLCDLYSGNGSADPRERAKPVAASTDGAVTETAEDTEPRPVRRRPRVEEPVRPNCTAPAGDPWHCYR